VNDILKWLLKSGVYFLEESDRNTAYMADRVKDRVHTLSRRARHVLDHQDQHPVRHAISFGAGIGLGIGIGMLLAPSAGEKTRHSIAGKVHEFGDTVKERFSSEKERLTAELKRQASGEVKRSSTMDVKRPATGTEGM
jgi:hypothetical protein